MAKITFHFKRLDGKIETMLINKNSKIPGFNYFTVGEFLVNKNKHINFACASEYDVQTCEIIRIMFNLPVIISSAGRTEEYNASVGGSKDSKHLYLYDVLDIIIPDATPAQLDCIYQFIIFRGYTGRGRYDGGRFHIDRGYREVVVEWDERSAA